MQKPRRRRGLELHVLSLSAVVLVDCAPAATRLEGPTPPAPVAAPPEPLPPVSSAALAPAPPEAIPGASPAQAGAGYGVDTEAEQPVQAEPAALEPAALEPAPRAELPRGTLILHIGDSFAAALGIPLAKRVKAAGLRYILQFKTASYIPTWAFGPELKKFVVNYNPDLVLITLGANELDIPDPPQRAGAIRRLIAAVGNKPCVWISPPLWKPDTGLLGVIRQNVAPCRYLDSDAIVQDLPRGRDKIHPSTEGREIWAEAVLAWLTASRDANGARAWTLRPDPTPEAYP